MIKFTLNYVLNSVIPLFEATAHHILDEKKHAENTSLKHYIAFL